MPGEAKKRYYFQLHPTSILCLSKFLHVKLLVKDQFGTKQFQTACETGEEAVCLNLAKLAWMEPVRAP